MGFLLMVKVPSLELSDMVEDNYSMQQINHALLRYVITNYANLRTKVEIHDEQTTYLYHQIATTELARNSEVSQIAKLTDALKDA